MLHNNFTSRLRVPDSGVFSERQKRAAHERHRIKEATRRLRTHAEKIAWHLAEMAAVSGRSGGSLPAHS